MHHIWKLLAISLLPVVVSAGLAAEGKSERESSKAAMTIHYGAYYNPPWVIRGKDEALLGITPEYVEAVEGRSGLDIQIDLKPFQRAIVDLKEGKVDMIASSDHPGLRQFAEPVVSFGDLQMTLFTRKSYQLKSVEDLKGMKIGILRGLPLEYLFTDHPEIELVYVNSEQSGFDSVSRGYLDGTVFAEVAYRYYAELNGWPYSHLHQSLFIGAIPVYAWTLKGRENEPRFKRLKATIEAMRKDGTRDAFMNGVGVDFGFGAE